MAIPDGFLGTVVVAMIAAAISLVGLVISKDQKTTEFRQAWIDSLREDAAEFLSYYAVFLRQIRVHDSEKSKELAFQEKLSPELRSESVKMERVYARILLRLNPKEHGDIVRKLDEIKAIYVSKTVHDEPAMNAHESELLSMLQLELKKEWRRVKSGELAFRIAKYAAVALTLFGVLLLLGILL